MKRLLLIATLISPPALALQTPVPGASDPHVCDVNYDPNEVTDVPAMIGNNIAIRFGRTDFIDKVAASDTSHLKRDSANDKSNILYLKATHQMPSQPISIRTVREDGSTRDYTLQWTAYAEDPNVKPKQVASNGDIRVEDVSSGKKINFCYLIRFNYPSDVTAAQAAASRKRRDKAAQDAAEIALHKAAEQRARNVHYVAQGDASIGPTQIYDDGYTTTMMFPGNARIPIILTRTVNGKESEVVGTTTEQGGVVKIHAVLPFVRLRDGDLTLCIFNRGYNAVGQNPGTGTTESDISRGVHP